MEKETLEEKKKWWRYRGMGRKECGKVALIGLAGFVICYSFGAGWIADIFGLVFWVAGILWIIKTIQYKRDLKRRIKKRLQELQIDPDKDYQAYYKIIREEENKS